MARLVEGKDVVVQGHVPLRSVCSRSLLEGTLLAFTKWLCDMQQQTRATTQTADALGILKS